MPRPQSVLVTVRQAEGTYVSGSNDATPDQRLHVGLVSTGDSTQSGFRHVVDDETLLIRDDADVLISVASGGTEDDQRLAGQIAFDLLFPRGKVRDAWTRILTECEGSGREVRLFLEISESLAWIPFEVAIPDDHLGRPLVMRDGISVARWIPDKQVRRAKGDGKFRAMVVGGAPAQREQFGGIEEWKVQMVEEIRDAYPSGLVVCEKSGIDRDEVQANASTYGPFDVLVLAVHGDAKHGVPQIYFESSKADSLPVTVEVFMDWFGAARCVILLACDSASPPSPRGTKHSGSDLASYSFARALAEAGVEATVGFVGKEKWEQARAIGASIVKSLAGGDDIYAAVRQARQQSDIGYPWGRLRLFAGGDGLFSGAEAGGQEVPRQAIVSTSEQAVVPPPTDDDPDDEDARAVSDAHPPSSVPVGVLSVGSRSHVYSVIAGSVVHRSYEDIAEIPLATLGVGGSARSESFALSPTGRLAVSLTGSQLQLARISSTTGSTSLVHPRPFTLDGEPLSVVAVDDPIVVSSSSATCLVSYAEEVRCVYLDAHSGSPDVVQTFEGAAFDGILSKKTVVILHDGGVTIEGDAFDFCRPALMASGGALRGIDFVRSGSERFVLAVYDDRLSIFGSTLRRSVDSGALAGLATALMVRPGKGISTVSAIGATMSGPRLHPVPD